jgi:hypothetical protein
VAPLTTKALTIQITVAEPTEKPTRKRQSTTSTAGSAVHPKQKGTRPSMPTTESITSMFTREETRG